MPVSDDGTAYDLSGAENAPVVVLIHGLGLDRSVTWRSIAPDLATGYRVLAYDLRGHGASRLPAGPITLAALSTQLVTLLDELGIPRAALVGFSLGGMINRRVAIDHPERVTALGVLNSPHERGAELQAKVEQQARDAGAGGPAATIDAALARWFTAGFRRDRPDLVNEIRDVVLANDPDNYAAHRLVLAEGVTELIRPQPALTHPALVMTCENDTGSTPQMSRSIADEIAGSEVSVVPRLQHLGLIEVPELFSRRILQFLDRVLD